MEHVLAHHGMNSSSRGQHDEPKKKTHRLNKRAAAHAPEPTSAPIRRPPNQPVEIHYQSYCPEDTHCSPYIDGDGSLHIQCLDNNPPKADNLDRGRDAKRQKMSQYGYRPEPQPVVKAGRSTADVVKTIHLLEMIPSASVGGVFVDDKVPFVIAPHNELHANDHGYTTKACKSGSPQDDDGGRECKPTRLWSFNKGESLTCNFAIASEQHGVFFYSILLRR
ncbi:hypothetical protein IWX90DRAFT_411490 [Phyllosticta citrichinensis]|uniref:Uncharacterized protein n=1 Tax=Phyllosticta citrichinensis TaxID=1130410 RepID=A0ABR1Y873_9PEZI